ncbi:MAG: type II secretion system protein [Rhodocyclaceae bacterium]
MRGFSLIEAIAVIVITGILGAIVAVFIRSPVQGYFDTVRRAQLTDTADTALRRIARDLRLALPNSVRLTASGGKTYLEFLQTRAGGRYRAECESASAGDPLVFGDASAYACEAADNSTFDVIGTAITMASGDQIVIYNLGITGADAYAGDTRRAYAGAPGAVAQIPYSGGQFPLASPGQRFHVVETPVTYECDPAGGVLRRYWGYAIAAAQPTPPTVATSALLADRIDPAAGCVFNYDPNIANTRTGLVSLQLVLTSSGESVRLFHQVHVNNVP